MTSIANILQGGSHMKTYLTKNNACFLPTLIFQTIQSLLAVFVAVLLSVLIDTVSESIQSRDTSPLGTILIVCTIYAVFLGLAVFCTGRLKGRCIRNAVTALKRDVMHSVLQKDITSYHQTSKGTYISMLNHNMGLIEENVFKNYFTVYEALLSMVLAAIVLFMTNPIVALFSLACTFVPTLIPKLYAKKLAASQKDAAEKAASYQSEVNEILDGYELIKNYAIENQAEARCLERLTQAEHFKYHRECEMAKLQGIASTASILTQFLIMLFAGFLAARGYITLGSIVAVTQLSGQVISPASQLTALFGLFTSVRPISEQVMELLNEHDACITPVLSNYDAVNTSIPAEHDATISPALPKHDDGRASTLPRHDAGESSGPSSNSGHNITFCDVSFSYGQHPVLKHLNLTLEKGKKYALTGNSGSGKSTILKLLMQYYPSYDGRILIDGTDLKEYGCFFKECAYVGQEIFLFHDTIEQNICLFQEPDKERLAYAVREAGLKDVLSRAEGGVHAMVGENGSNFSGGERQRIAIARALYHQKKILLFDEATSALDSGMAEKIERLILHLKDVTCLFVSHQLSSSCTGQYDRILRLDAGTLSA